MWPALTVSGGRANTWCPASTQSLKRMAWLTWTFSTAIAPTPTRPRRNNGRARLHCPQRPGAVRGSLKLFAEQTRRAAQILRDLGTPCLIHQPRYNMFDRWIEGGLLDVLSNEGIGCIVFSPLAQGLLTGRYLDGVRPTPAPPNRMVFSRPTPSPTTK